MEGRNDRRFVHKLIQVSFAHNPTALRELLMDGESVLYAGLCTRLAGSRSHNKYRANNRSGLGIVHQSARSSIDSCLPWCPLWLPPTFSYIQSCAMNKRARPIRTESFATSEVQMSRQYNVSFLVLRSPSTFFLCPTSSVLANVCAEES